MSFTRDEVSQIKEYVKAVRKHSWGVEIEIDRTLNEQKIAYKGILLFLLNRDFVPIRRLFERKLPGKILELDKIQQEIKADMKGLDWIWEDKEKGLLFCPLAPGASIDKFTGELLDGIKTERKTDSVKEPSKIAMQAYLTLKSLGCSQKKCAEIMTKKLKRNKPLSQGQISKWNSECVAWLKANNLDVFPTEMTKKIITMDSNKLDMGARTDGKTTGDPRHKKLVDPDGDIYD